MTALPVADFGRSHTGSTSPDPTGSDLTVIVLAAGKGTRMGSDLPKVLHPLGGRPMIQHVLAGIDPLGAHRSVVVLAPGMDAVAKAVRPARTAIQAEARGTGHAVSEALPGLGSLAGDVLVVYGDTPLILPQTYARLLEERRRAPAAAVVVLGMRPADPGHYGRLVLGDGNRLERIVEAAELAPEEQSIGLCNSGVMAIDGALLPGLIARLGNHNAKGEYYLTDIVELAHRDGHEARVVEADAEELLGVNSRIELAAAEKVLQKRLREAALLGGATLVDPDTVYFCSDTKVGRDVTIGPFVVFGPGVEIGDGVEIQAFSHITGARIGREAKVGPFARLRPGARLGERARIGNFVEVKEADIGEAAAVNHLSYIGDAQIGARANIGAGTITCNYDGFRKSTTWIGAQAFIGSNTALVAPVRVGDRAIVGAGSVITRNVPDDALAIARGGQVEKPGAAELFRERHSEVERRRSAKQDAGSPDTPAKTTD